MNWYKTSQIEGGYSLWLDDERNPQDPSIQKLFGSRGDEIWIKSQNDAIQYLSTGKVKSISFDHDLGDENEFGNGYGVATWIEEKAFLNEIQPLEWRVHSQNPTGAKKIIAAMNNAEKFWSKA